MYISVHLRIYLFITHTCVCIRKEGWVQPSRRPGSAWAVSRAVGANPRGKQPCWIVHVCRAWSTKGSYSCLSFLRRWRGETSCAVVKMTLFMCFLQMRLFQLCDPGALQSSTLKDLWWVWNLDHLGLSEGLHAWHVCTLLSFPLSHGGTLHLWLNLLFRYC